MAEPALVRDCVRAMRDAVALPVTVKHRIGLDRVESYDFVRDFVGTVGEGGCEVFIVHARNAWLNGLSPKGNREVPPLRHDTVAKLKRDFPHRTFVINGGLTQTEQVRCELQRVDGVMIGRAAYHDPWRLREWQAAAFGAEHADASDRCGGRGVDGPLHGTAGQRTRHAVDIDRAPHDGPASRPAWRSALAAGVVGPPPAGLGARAGGATRTAGAGPRNGNRLTTEAPGCVGRRRATTMATWPTATPATRARTPPHAQRRTAHAARSLRPTRLRPAAAP